MRPSLTWEARYTDGTVFPQFEGETENRYEAIDRARLASFALYRDDGEQVTFRTFAPGERLLFRRRTTLVQGGQSATVYLVGAFVGTDQQIDVFNDAGELIYGARPAQSDHPQYYSVVPVDCEA